MAKKADNKTLSDDKTPFFQFPSKITQPKIFKFVIILVL